MLLDSLSQALHLALRAYFHTGRPIPVHAQLPTTDGRPLDVLASALPEYDPEGNLVRVLASCAPVGATQVEADRVEWEERVFHLARCFTESEPRFQEEADRCPEAVLAIDTAGKVLHASAAFQRLFGFAPAGETLSTPLPPSDLQAPLRRAAEEWRMTFDAVNIPLVVLDRDGRVRRLNAAAREVIDKPFRQVVNLPIERLGGEPWLTVGELARQLAAKGGQVSDEIREAATGRTWDISGAVASGPAVGEQLIFVARDITRVIELQASLRRSETMSVMGQLVGGVAHEVRNPLFAISAALDAFESRFADRDEYKRYIQVFREEINRLNALTAGLLEYGKPTLDGYVSGSVLTVLAESVRVCDRLAAEAGVTIEVLPSGELPPVRIEPTRLGQVFQNVIQNAVQFSPRGGRVEVEVREVLIKGARQIECVVCDEGPGIRPEDLPRLFEPFFSRRHRGVGLGLPIVQRILEDHRGTIQIGNRVQGGAIARIRLPIGDRGA